MGAVSRLKRAGVAVGLAACLLPAIGGGLWSLFRFYSGQSPGTGLALGEWHRPGSGERVLPANVQSMLALLRENGIREFRYSRLVAPDEATQQRLAEGAYPILLHLRARHWLLQRGETLARGCRVVAANDEVILADCG